MRKDCSDVVGKKIPTPAGGILTVVGYTKNVRKQCRCYCSICSEDTELFPDKYFYVNFSALNNGRFPCGCTNYKWNKEQYEVRVKRRCRELGYEFLGSGRRCSTCATANMNFGYYANRVDEVDYLYVYKIEELPYIRIGRTFNPERRLKENINRILDYYGEDFSLTLEQSLFTAKHSYVYEKEQELLGNTRYNIFSKNKYSIEDSYGSSELLDESMYQFVIDNLREDKLIEEVKPVEKTIIVYEAS